MKRNELKSYIREEIIATLSEDVAYQVTGTSGKTVQSFKNDQEAKDFDSKSSNVTVKKLEEEKYSFPEVVSIIADIINNNLSNRGDLEVTPEELAREILDELDNNGLINHSNTDANDETLDEMARAKVSYALNTDKAQDLKDVIEKAKGNVKKALEYLLDKETMSVADVAKELGLKDTASINNPKFR